MADYPDWTSMVNIQGSQITFGFNLQAQEADLTVNIAAQTIESIKINIIAQDVGVYLQADWSALQDTDKNFKVILNNANFGEGHWLDYPVDADKTLFITGLSFSSNATVVADADTFLSVIVTLRDATDGVNIVETGGVVGGGMSFAKPIVFPGGHTFRLYVTSVAQKEAHIAATAWGYEV